MPHNKYKNIFLHYTAEKRCADVTLTDFNGYKGVCCATDQLQGPIYYYYTTIRLLVGLLSEKIQIFVSASLALKLRRYTQNTPIRRNPSSEFRKKNFLTVIF